MVNGIKIPDNSHRARYRAQQKRGQAPFFHFKGFAFGERHRAGNSRHQITEKSFLEGGQIPCKPNKKAHQREGDGGKDKTKHPLPRRILFCLGGRRGALALRLQSLRIFKQRLV